MKQQKARKRRQFLKNTYLTTLGLGVSQALSARPNIGKVKSGRDSSMDCQASTADYFGEGPFYTENPPMVLDGQLAGPEEAGERMIISGRVFNLDCSQFIPNAIVDVWHADHTGAYDNDGFRLRAQTRTNEQGFYLFETIKPGKYRNGNSFRPSHIHYKVTPPGFDILTTQLYFAGHEDLERDPASSITSGEFDASDRIISLATNTEGKLEGAFDIMLNGQGVTGVNDLHIDKGMIYGLSPNPFTDQLLIRYGIFKRERISLQVYNLLGHLVATLEEGRLAPEKYEAIWRPNADLPPGHYFIVLKVNELQVHYFKALKHS